MEKYTSGRSKFRNRRSILTEVPAWDPGMLLVAPAGSTPTGRSRTTTAQPPPKVSGSVGHHQIKDSSGKGGPPGPFLSPVLYPWACPRRCVYRRGYTGVGAPHIRGFRMCGRPWINWRQPGCDWSLRQFIPTHSNVRNEWGTRHQSRYRKLVRAVMKDTGGWLIGTKSRVSNPRDPGHPAGYYDLGSGVVELLT